MPAHVERTVVDFWLQFREQPAPAYCASRGPCWIWPGPPDSTGYGRWGTERYTRTRIHVYAWELLEGPVPSKMCVCHYCDVKLCGSPAHLFLGTGSDNIRDMWAKGRARPVTKTNGVGHRAKLTPEQVREIRVLLVDGKTHRALAERYHVSPTAIWLIATRRNWAHLV
jgi:hypothetical protein